MEILTDEQANEKVDHSFIETFKRYALLKMYAEVLRFPFFFFYKGGGHVRYDDHLKSSHFEPFPLLGGRAANLVIGAKDRKDYMEIIWSSFHEWGHLSQPTLTDEIRLNPRLTHLRESDAWDRAETKLKDFAILQPHMHKFYIYRDQCLNDYYDKIPK